MINPRRRRAQVTQNAHAVDGGKVTQIGGDRITHHHHYSSQSSDVSSGPRRILVGVIPAASDCFQERETGTGLLEAFADTGAAGPADGVRSRSWILTGTGGVGKTQIAAACGRRAWDAGEYTMVVWVNASSRPSILGAYAAAARELSLDVEEESEDLSVAADRFLSWAQSTENSWLVVLDDIQSVADVRRLWPDAQRNRQVVVATTRLRDASLSMEGRRQIDVELFTPIEARRYLTAKFAAHERSDDPEVVDSLAADLGWLPLALAQAAALIVDTSLGCDEYRARFADRARKLSDLVPEPDRLPDDHYAIITTTWSLSVEHANRARPAGLARPLLELLSVLDPNGVPLDLLTCPAVLGYLALHHPDTHLSWPWTTGHRQRRLALKILAHPDASLRWHQRWVQQSLQRFLAPVTGEEIIDAMAVLNRYNLISRDHDAPLVRIHQLIQRATREAVPHHRLTEAQQVAADALFTSWPDADHRDLARLLRANTAVLTSVTGMALHDSDGVTHPLWPRAALSLSRVGHISAAAAEFARIHMTAVQRLGSEHPHTLAVHANLVVLQGEAGDALDAIAALEGSLANCIRFLGPDHVDTLSVRVNLAEFRGKAGDAAAAIAEFESVLADCERGRALEHLTLTVRNNLARWYGEAGDAPRAVVALEAVVADCTRILGPDHPDTLSARNNLADWRGFSGDTEETVAALHELLADCVRVLGPDHADTLSTRGYLAIWQARSGDVALAIGALENLLADQQRALGPDHPETAKTTRNLRAMRESRPITRIPPGRKGPKPRRRR